MKRFLGLQLMNLYAGLNKLIKPAIRSFNLHSLKEIKKNLPVKERLLFYNCYILPHLNYCCSVWGNCLANQKNWITKLQKRAARLILDADLSIPSSDLFKKLKWLPLP